MVKDRLVNQVEFANLIVINILASVSNEDALEVEAVLRALYSRAKIYRTIHGQVPLHCMQDTDMSNYDKSRNSANWINEPKGDRTPETEEYVVSRFTNRGSATFNNEKVWVFLNDKVNWRGVQPSKGSFWVATDHRIAYLRAHSGGVNNVIATGIRWPPLPRKYWDKSDEKRLEQYQEWHPLYGDCHQAFVFIGRYIVEATLSARVDACLLENALASRDSKKWIGLPNPFCELEMVDGVAT